MVNYTSFFYQDVDKMKSLNAFETDRSTIELKEEIGHGEFGRYMYVCVYM